MNRAIIVSVHSDVSELAEQTVKSLGFGYTAVISGGSEARRIIMSGAAPELIIIISPLPDEFGSDLAELAAENPGSGVVLIAPGDIAGELSDRFYGTGIIVLSRPATREQLSEAIVLSTDSISSFPEEKESSEVLSRIDDIRLINRAKAALMKYLKFTEPQAHRYLEKQAMNSRCTRRQAAEQIIRTYLIDN